MIRNESQSVEYCRIPFARVDVEKACARGHRDADATLARQVLQQQLTEGDPAPDLFERLRLGSSKPAELAWPVAPVQDAPRPRVDCSFVEALAKARHLSVRARIKPQIDRRQGPAV